MRKSIAALLAGAALATAATPAAAQEADRGVLGRLLEVILGPSQTESDPEGEVSVEQAAEPTFAQNRLDRVIANKRRDDDRARDMWRHPKETLQFFRVLPRQTVVDYMPAGGWYTRVLAPYLGRDGVYIGLTPDPAAADGERFRDYFAGLPGKFREEALRWSLAGAPVAIYGSQDIPEELNGNVDRVLIFREMHNLLRSGAAYTELMRIRSLLKPDGLVGVVQHRARADAPGDYTLGGNGYLREKDVVAMFELHGFELVDRSEINANANDPANWQGGVWSMPPVLAGDDAMDARTRNLGESDRMTLLFRKR